MSSDPPALAATFQSRSRSDEVVTRRPLRILGCQQAFHVAVTHDEAGDLQPGLLHKLGAQMHIMPEVIDTQLQTFQGKARLVTPELGRQWLLG